MSSKSSTVDSLYQHPVLKYVLQKFHNTTGLQDKGISERLKKPVDNTYDSLVAPFKLNANESSIKSFIADIVKYQTEQVDIKPFETDTLQTVLHLAHSAEVRKYHGPSRAFAPIEKEKKRKSGGRLSKQMQLQMGEKEEVASIYANEMDDQEGPKRSRYNEEEDEDEDEDDEYNPENTKSTVLPLNFYDVAKSVFDTFWNLEFDDKEVTWAFFAKINAQNCLDFNVQSFAENSTCLAVIKEKLDNSLYPTIDSFLYDFHQMFDNIFTYYAPEHPAVTKGKELHKLFEETWVKEREKFNWSLQS